MDKETLVQNYEANLAKGGYTAQYVRRVRDFLSYADGLDRKSVEAWLQRLQRRGYNPGTIKLCFRIVRRLFVVNGLEWPFSRGEAPQVAQRDEYRPQLPPEYVGWMIEAATAGELSTDECCYLALSTTYGLRREEMVNLGPRDLDLSAGTMFVATAKHGRERYHLIPREILPYLEAHDFHQPYYVSGMSQLFWQVVNKSGLEGLRSQRLGWHAIRRTLLTALMDSGLNMFSVRAFMRWKGMVAEAAELSMPATYYGNVTVTLDGTRPVTQEAQGDRTIFEKHPFLPYWREEA